MEIRTITNRVYYLPSEESTDRPVLGYIKGDKYSLAVDAGNSSNHVKEFYLKLKELDLRLPDFNVITHWHWDHTFGMHSVSGKTIVSHSTNTKLNEVQKWEWNEKAMEGRLQSGEDIEICDRCIKLEYPDREKIKVVTGDIEFTGNISIDLGGVHCIIREFNATHSSDSVLVHVLEERVVFLGDAVSGDYYQNKGEYDQAKLKEMIRILESIDVDIFVLGHDVPETKNETLRYLKEQITET